MTILGIVFRSLPKILFQRVRLPIDGTGSGGAMGGGGGGLEGAEPPRIDLSLRESV